MIVSELDGLIWRVYQVGINSKSLLNTREIIGDETNAVEFDVKLVRVVIGTSDPMERWLVVSGNDDRPLTTGDLQQLYQIYGPGELLVEAEEIKGVTDEYTIPFNG